MQSHLYLLHLNIQFAVLLTGVKDLLDDCSHLSLQHGVEQFDNQDQAGAKHQQRKSQQDQAHSQVRQIHIHKEMLTCGHTETHTLQTLN